MSWNQDEQSVRTSGEEHRGGVLFGQSMYSDERSTMYSPWPASHAKRGVGGRWGSGLPPLLMTAPPASGGKTGGPRQLMHRQRPVEARQMAFPAFQVSGWPTATDGAVRPAPALLWPSGQDRPRRGSRWIRQRNGRHLMIVMTPPPASPPPETSGQPETPQLVSQITFDLCCRAVRLVLGLHPVSEQGHALSQQLQGPHPRPVLNIR